jgi:hypothetical protein
VATVLYVEVHEPGQRARHGDQHSQSVNSQLLKCQFLMVNCHSVRVMPPTCPRAQACRVRDFHGKILRAFSTGNISTENFPENWKWKYFHFFHWKKWKSEKCWKYFHFFLACRF